MSWVVEAVAPQLLRNGGLASIFIGSTLMTTVYTYNTYAEACSLSLYAEAIRNGGANVPDVYKSAPPHCPKEEVVSSLVACEARVLAKHAVSISAVGAWTGISAYFAYADTKHYRGTTPLQLEALSRRLPFPMLRVPSLAVFSASTCVAWVATGGGLRFQPLSPPHLDEARAYEATAGISAASTIRRRTLSYFFPQLGEGSRPSDE